MLSVKSILQSYIRGERSPEGRPQDAISDDKVKFFQVGGGSVLQHAVPLEAVIAVRQPPGHLRHLIINNSSFMEVKMCSQASLAVIVLSG